MITDLQDTNLSSLWALISQRSVTFTVCSLLTCQEDDCSLLLIPKTENMKNMRMMCRNSVCTSLRNKIAYAKLVGPVAFQTFCFVNRRERECISKIALLILIWKWTTWSMYILRRSYFKCSPPRPIEKPELTLRAGILVGISLDNWWA